MLQLNSQTWSVKVEPVGILQPGRVSFGSVYYCMAGKPRALGSQGLWEAKGSGKPRAGKPRAGKPRAGKPRTGLGFNPLVHQVLIL